MRKRTTPKIFGRAKELHRNTSPAEAQAKIPACVEVV
jgi:hypothetical protein